MPSSFSESLRLNLQASGENLNLWGEILNSGVFALLDDAVAGFTSVAVTGNLSLTTANGSADEARSAILKFTGTPAGLCTITLPNVSKVYLVWNATNRQLTFSHGSGSTVTLDASDIAFIFTDGANVQTPGYGGYPLKTWVSAQVLAATGSLPAAAGQAGKYLYSDGSTWAPRQPVSSDLSDYGTAILGRTAALAVALSA